MKYAGKSKIGRLSAKKGTIYAQIRLPKQFADTIGDTANIYKTEHDSKRAFLLVTNQHLRKSNAVLQPH
jgi:hypothetical protein